MESFLDLLAAGQVDMAHLITHAWPFGDAPAIYEKLHQRDRDSSDLYLGVALEYPGASIPDRTVALPVATARRRLPAAATPRIALIGAGKFLRGTFLPILRGMEDIRIRAVATQSGVSARALANELGCDYCTSDYREILRDPEIDAVIVTTRHNLHGAIAQEALRAQKACYLEKPLAITPEEVDVIEAVYAEEGGILQVGFNRRFAPCIQQVHEHLANVGGPRVLSYRCAAGRLPPTSWVHDPEVGGGRIIGEACHFADLARYLIGASPTRVYAEQVAGSGGHTRDDVVITLRFADGSVATILYLAMAGRGIGKEQIEVLCEGAAARVDDFSACTLARGDEPWQPVKLVTQDKGHAAALRAFADAVREGADCPVPVDQAIEATRVTFAALRSVEKREPVELLRGCSGG